MFHIFIFIIFYFFGNINVYADVYGFHPNSRLYLGAGYDKLNPSKAFLSCLEFDKIHSVSGEKPISSSLEISGVSSSKEFHKKIGFSAFLEGSYLFTSMEASVSYDYEKQFSASSFNWLVSIKSDYGTYALKNPRLKKEFTDLDQETLQDRCGTEFVIEEKRSIQVFALLSLRNVSESEKKELQAKLSVASNGGFFDVSFESAYKDFMSKAEALGQISIKLYTLGGRGLNDFEELLHIENFMNYETILGIFRESLSLMQPEHAAASLFMTTGLESFYLLTKPLFNFRKSILLELYYQYQSLSDYYAQMKEYFGKIDFSVEEHEEFFKQKDLLLISLRDLESNAKQCFSEEHQESCKLKSSQDEIKFHRYVRNLECEMIRQETFKEGIFSNEMYLMAKKRNFIPFVKNGSVDGFGPCWL